MSDPYIWEGGYLTIQLRQICLVAEKLDSVIDDLTAILGIKSCYVDPGVGAFGAAMQKVKEKIN